MAESCPKCGYVSPEMTDEQADRIGKQLVNAINAHCDKGNGIYVMSGSMPGGRYFRAKAELDPLGAGLQAYVTPDFGRSWVLVSDDAIFSDGNWNVPIPGVPTRRS